MDIVIFQPPEKKETISNKTERQLHYEDLSKTSKIEPYHFRSFYKMEQDSIKNTIPSSNINSVLLKFLLNFVDPIGSHDDKLYSC